jgi:tRNA1(Val) A37 N6-methylase TrmN6
LDRIAKKARWEMFLYQPERGYRYNSDSIFLYDFVRNNRIKGKLLDVGCGVGIISLLLGRDFPLEVSISEKQPRMLAYARHNFSVNRISVRAYGGDFLEAEIGEKFDWIVSNPPFYDSGVTQSMEESINIARYSHHLPLEPFIKKVKRLLKPRGTFAFCYDAKQSDILFSRLRAEKLVPEIIRFIHPKMEREAKTVMVKARAGSRSMCRVLPPLIVFGSDGKYTGEAFSAFRNAGTYSVTADGFDCKEEME